MYGHRNFVSGYFFNVVQNIISHTIIIKCDSLSSDNWSAYENCVISFQLSYHYILNENIQVKEETHKRIGGTVVA